MQILRIEKSYTLKIKIMHPKLFFDSSKEIVEIARELRQHQTKAEKVLWQQLRNRKLNGYKFRRQHYIERYVVDFYCAEKMLSVELDGKIHLDPEQALRDKERSLRLKEIGIKELRFTNEEIFDDIKNVLLKIKTELDLTPNPFPPGEWKIGEADQG